MVLVLDSLLASSIARISKTRQAMIAVGSKEEHGSGTGNRRELNAAYVVLMMGSLPLLIYIPNAIFWLPYVILSLIPNWNAQVTTLFVVLGRITLSLSVIVHFWNLFFYSFRVRGFFWELKRLLTCGLFRTMTSASQQSTSMASLATPK